LGCNFAQVVLDDTKVTGTEDVRESETSNTFDDAEHKHRPAQSLDIIENIRGDIRGFLAAQFMNHDEHKTAYTIFHILDLLFNEGDILGPFSRRLSHAFMGDPTLYAAIKTSASSSASFAPGTGSKFANFCKSSTVFSPASKIYVPGEGTTFESSSSSSPVLDRGSGADFSRHNQEKQPGVLEGMVAVGTVGWAMGSARSSTNALQPTAIILDVKTHCIYPPKAH
jgi:hypothetical protein